MKKLQVFLLLAYALLLTSCAEMFQGKVDMVVADNGGGLAGLLQEKSVITELTAPSQLIVSTGDSSTHINLIWQAVEGAVCYQLERVVVEKDASGMFPFPTENLFEVVETSIYGTSYQDVFPRDFNARYYYRVCAKNERDGLENSPYSSIEYGTVFGIPQQAQADLGASSSSITVRWKPVNDAVGYEIYRSYNNDGSGSILMASVTENQLSYTNSISKEEQGKEFYYTVYAVNRLGVRSSASSIAMGFSLIDGAPAEPKNVQITDGRGTTKDSISISWDAVASQKDVTYYVYRSSSVDSALAQVGKLEKQTANTITFTDKKSLKQGIYYYYQIQASIVDDLDKELKSPFSNSGRITSDGLPNPDAAEGFILSPTEELIAEKNASGTAVTLKWIPALGSSDEKSKYGNEQVKYKYKIYAGIAATGPFPDLVKEVGPGSIPNDTGYISVEVEPRSYYIVRTENPEIGIESANSIVAAPTPSAAKIGTASHAEYLGDIFSANSSGVYPVRITWEKPNDSDLAGFHIYRSNSRDSGYRKITDVPLSANTTSYIDANETSKAGKKYWYKVLSVNSLGQGSDYSEPREGWGALTHEQYLREFNKTVVAAQKKLTLMHKPGNTDKLGSETMSGEISGTISYSASISGLGAKIIMRYEGYADFFVDGTQDVYFKLTGNSNTEASMDSSGTMNGTVTCTGMYPGKVSYDSIQIKGGAAGGGTYGVQPEGFPMKQITYTLIN